MSGLNNLMKEGWHSKGKDGKRESWRGDFKGINQVAGWMGKGKDPNEDREEHVSRPLSSLKDPSSFGPPPKHINYHGAAALPNETTPDRRGTGTPLSEQNYEQNLQQQQAMEAEEEAQRPRPPPVPYRADTTGLSTNHLPPPVRRLDSPNSTSSATGKPKPQLPPRLPSRTASPALTDLPPPPAYSPVPPTPEGYINREAATRLSRAGVSVPALGIGEKTESAHITNGQNDPALDNMQSRFSTTHSPSANNPYPMSADSSLPPLPTFRDRHQDKIDLGKQKWGGVTSRFNTFVEDRKFSAAANKRIPRPGDLPRSSTAPSTAPSPAPKPVPKPVHVPGPAIPSRAVQSPPTESSIGAQAQRKKPPPPPPKRAEMRTPINTPSDISTSPTPPPVPLSTKPR
ncbi:hypothetical protein N7495_002041 [Penicillium taxi]|uniref:uncharacterized protein n=1 Tax=Penicillium taxi TaxID=168475 RepID=UPI0025458DE4|nr:uncharacterized protein N7495_002041 [Penicillium taxi]KAJ5901513.1 hypothetical protein N7495_002041 [Penicillium taxi]